MHALSLDTSIVAQTNYSTPARQFFPLLWGLMRIWATILSDICLAKRNGKLASSGRIGRIDRIDIIASLVLYRKGTSVHVAVHYFLLCCCMLPDIMISQYGRHYLLGSP